MKNVKLIKLQSNKELVTRIVEMLSNCLSWLKSQSQAMLYNTRVLLSLKELGASKSFSAHKQTTLTSYFSFRNCYVTTGTGTRVYVTRHLLLHYDLFYKVPSAPKGNTLRNIIMYINVYYYYCSCMHLCVLSFISPT